MKNHRNILFAGIFAVTIGLVGSVNAQYRVIEDDGIAASPKVRQMLNERKAWTTVQVSSSAVASVGYRATGSDGITASPRVRQQLDERSTVIEVAPIK